MIKSNELRQGNYVKDGSKYRIVTLEDFWAEYKGKEHFYYMDPILLTPEILEKCGFKKSSLVGNLYTLETKGIGFAFSHEVILIYDLRNSLDTQKPPIIKLGRKHLHELQNIFFYLTGEELQIDINSIETKAS